MAKNCPILEWNPLLRTGKGSYTTTTNKALAPGDLTWKEHSIIVETAVNVTALPGMF
jgi:hypothetical protein